MLETVVVSLVIPFIALSLLSVMLDRFALFLEGIMKRVPFLPDKFEWWVAYIVVLSAAFLVCWQLDFQIFRYLGLDAKYSWFDWLLTSLIISGGSTFLKTQFNLINDIPSILNITNSFRRLIISSNNTTKETKNKKEIKKEKKVDSSDEF